MNELKFDFKDSMVLPIDLNLVEKNMMDEIDVLNNVVKNKNYEDYRSFINLPYDEESLNNIKKIIYEKKKLNPKYLIVIGIGGSNLGTTAIQEAILGKLYNELNPDIKILYADTVDSDIMSSIIQVIEPILQKGENIIVNVISKSGSTIETIANSEIILNLLKKYKKNYYDYVVVTSDKDSKLWELALEEKFTLLEIPKKVVGRYSVFSAVGLFPLGLIGVNIDLLLYGAKDITRKSINKNLDLNPAAKSASLIYIHYKRGRNIHNLFLFSPGMESIGRWYKQLMAESLGKEYNLKREHVFTGITPIVSIGSTDLHSMTQLYLAGPDDKFTTFVKVKHNRNILRVPKERIYSKLVKGIQEKKLQTLMTAVYKGVTKTFRNHKRPFMEVLINNKSEYAIGQFLQYKMIEMVYLGHLMDINPFNQPNVEEYKAETRKILERKKED